MDHKFIKGLVSVSLMLQLYFRNWLFHSTFFCSCFQDKSEQSRSASDSVIQNLEEKIADMENHLCQPSVESTEEVIRLRTRLQESEQMLQQAEKQIGELETKKDSWRQEVNMICFLWLFVLVKHRTCL